MSNYICNFIITVVVPIIVGCYLFIFESCAKEFLKNKLASNSSNKTIKSIALLFGAVFYIIFGLLAILILGQFSINMTTPKLISDFYRFFYSQSWQQWINSIPPYSSLFLLGSYKLMQIVEEPWFIDTSKKAKSENKNTSDGNTIPSSGKITITIESGN